MQRPSADELPAYAQRYAALVPEGDPVSFLTTQGVRTADLLRHLPEDRAGHRYAPGKWSVREVLGHLSDTERVLAYRTVRIARGDATPMPGFDENAWVANAGFDRRSIRDLVLEFAKVRAATVALFQGLAGGDYDRRGTANNHAVSVRGLLWFVAGHELHHLAVLHERYGVG
jgi:uncharacterized damage-inducible protein DinB